MVEAHAGVEHRDDDRALPVVMSHASSALIEAGAVPVGDTIEPAAPGGFRYHWPTSGPPLVGVDGSL